jgi:hypothetical protein
MWDAWDLAVDQCLNQMPEVVEKAERLEKEKAERERHNTGEKTDKAEPVELYHTGKRFSTFFEEQLTAFEVCTSPLLSYLPYRATNCCDYERTARSITDRIASSMYSPLLSD